MNTFNKLLRATAASSLLFCLSPSVGAAPALEEQVLYIDGKVRADGTDLNGARVLVERDGVVVQMITESVGRMHMALELQRVYILSFEREGCMTKRLFFDTHVPLMALVNAPFKFPFKVTLEKMEAGPVMYYTQPVGYIRYYGNKMDFDYDTNYKMHREEAEREERLKEAAEKTMNPRSTAITQADFTTQKSVLSYEPSTALDQLEAEKETTPRETVTDAGVMTARRVEPGPLVTAPPIKPLITLSPAPVAARSEPTLTRTRTIISAPPPIAPLVRERPVVTRIVHIPPPQEVVLPDGRSEELVIEKNYVATIIRITEQGHTKEYRRIAHSYGATHYFMNGVSIGEIAYTTAIRK